MEYQQFQKRKNQAKWIIAKLIKTSTSGNILSLIVIWGVKCLLGCKIWNFYLQKHLFKNQIWLILIYEIIDWIGCPKKYATLCY